MATKDDFTTEEWITLRALMQAAFFNTAVADRWLYDEEAEVWGRLRPYTVPFVQALIARSEDPAEDTAVLDKAVQVTLPELVSEARQILQDKATYEEADNLKRTLQALARAVAEADNEVVAKEERFLSALEWLLQDWCD